MPPDACTENEPEPRPEYRTHRPIPEKIVAALNELGAQLAAWSEHGRDQTLAVHEASVLRLVRQILPGLLEAVIEAATSGLGVWVTGESWSVRRRLR